MSSSRISFIGYYFFLTLTVFLFSCKSLVSPKSKIKFSRSINITQGVKDMDLRFGSHLIEQQKATYLVYLNNYQKIIFVNLNDSLDKPEIDFMQYISGCKVFDARLDSAFLYFWNHDNKTFTVFLHNKGRLLEVKKQYNLSKILDWNQYYIKYQPGNTFAIVYPALYLAYGIYNPGTTFLDSTAYLKINLFDSLRNYSIAKVGPQPVATRKGLYYEYDSFISQIGDSELVIGYRSYDSVYKLNGNTSQVVGKNSFSDNSGFLKFDRKQEPDLSYVREYSQTTELNINNIFLNNKNLLIVKRLKTNDIYDKKFYELYILNSDLKVVLNKAIADNINPHFLYAYSKGFLCLDSSLSKALYYELF